MFEAAALVESLERGHDELRVDLVDLVPTEAELFHVAWADVLYEHVCLEQVGEDLLAFRVLHVERDRLLVGVELQEVQRVRAVDVVHLVTGRVAAMHLLELDDLGAQPCENLGARRARLNLRPVDYLDACQWGSAFVSHT